MQTIGHAINFKIECIKMVIRGLWNICYDSVRTMTDTNVHAYSLRWSYKTQRHVDWHWTNVKTGHLKKKKEVFYSVAFYEKTESKPSIEDVQRDTLSERKVARTLTTCQSKLSLSPDELTSKPFILWNASLLFVSRWEREGNATSPDRGVLLVRLVYIGYMHIDTPNVHHQFHILKLIYLTRTIVETPKMNCNNNNHKIKMTMMVMIKRAN